MTEERTATSELEQLKNFFFNMHFMNIFKSFRMAIAPNKMILAFLAVISLVTLGAVMDTVSSSVVRTDYKKASSYYHSRLYQNTPLEVTELDVYICEPSRLETFKSRFAQDANPKGVFTTSSSFMTAKFNDFVVCVLNMELRNAAVVCSDVLKAMGWALRHHTIFSIIYVTGACFILGLFGGAICRAAAMEYALNDKPGPACALKFSKSRLSSFVFAPVAPLVLILFLGSIIFCLGLAANLPWIGEIILGVLMIATLLFGIAIALAFVGATGGLIMSMPAVAFEGNDSYDAMSRSYCYSFSKPWKLFFYTAVATVYGALCYLFVRFFAFVILISSHAFLKAGMFTHSAKAHGIDKLEAVWPKPEFFNFAGTQSGINTAFTEDISKMLVGFAVMLIACAVASFVLSFFYSSSVIIYSLMRNLEDKTPINEIYIKIHHIEETQEDVIQSLQNPDKIEPGISDREYPEDITDADSSDPDKNE